MAGPKALLEYRVMADAAAHQAAHRRISAGSLVPEGGRWKSSWHRVRGIVRESLLPPLLGILAADAWVVFLDRTDPGSAPIWIWALPLMTIYIGVMAFRGTWRALRFVLTSTKDVGMPVRYVLLHSYATGSPWLILFEDLQAEDAKPTGGLALRYGPKRDLFRDLPAPVGTALLAGVTRMGAIVVPRVNGRILWPTAPYRDINLNDLRYVQTLCTMVQTDP